MNTCLLISTTLFVHFISHMSKYKILKNPQSVWKTDANTHLESTKVTSVFHQWHVVKSEIKMPPPPPHKYSYWRSSRRGSNKCILRNHDTHTHTFTLYSSHIVYTSGWMSGMRKRNIYIYIHDSLAHSSGASSEAYSTCLVCYEEF